MLKHYFRRRNPVLYGEDPKQNPVSGTDVGGEQPSPKTADEIIFAEEKDPEYALLTTAFGSAEQSLIESLLRSENIPYVLRRQDNESWKPAFLGAALLRTEIYVPQPLLDAAGDLIAPALSEDKAENGEIPDEVADEGGWFYYNRNHGLAADNRFLAEDANLGEAPEDGETEAAGAVFDENAPLLYDEETGYARLITTMDDEEQLRIEAVLRGADISYVIREHDADGRISVVMGAPLFGNDIFVPEPDLDAAADLIVDLTCETAGDKAENGRIPAEVADAGGWYFYNQKHGLAEDNRELIGDRAETEQLSGNADNIH